MKKIIFALMMCLQLNAVGQLKIEDLDKSKLALQVNEFDLVDYVLTVELQKRVTASKEIKKGKLQKGLGLTLAALGGVGFYSFRKKDVDVDYSILSATMAGIGLTNAITGHIKIKLNRDKINDSIELINRGFEF